MLNRCVLLLVGGSLARVGNSFLEQLEAPTCLLHVTLSEFSPSRRQIGTSVHSTGAKVLGPWGWALAEACVASLSLEVVGRHHGQVAVPCVVGRVVLDRVHRWLGELAALLHGRPLHVLLVVLEELVVVSYEVAVLARRLVETTTPSLVVGLHRLSLDVGHLVWATSRAFLRIVIVSSAVDDHAFAATHHLAASWGQPAKVLLILHLRRHELLLLPVVAAALALETLIATRHFVDVSLFVEWHLKGVLTTVHPWVTLIVVSSATSRATHHVVLIVP